MNSESTTTTTNRGRMGGGTPPTKPSDDANAEMGQMPEMCDTADEECQMPEMPEICDESDENCEAPEMPADMQGMGPGGGGFKGQMLQGTGSDSILHPVGYLALGSGSVILAMVVAYACFSKFFHKKPGQTFDKGSKFAWYCVASVVLAAGLITLCYFIPIWAS